MFMCHFYVLSRLFYGVSHIMKQGHPYILSSVGSHLYIMNTVLSPQTIQNIQLISQPETRSIRG